VGIPFVVAAPSGTGKTTVCQRVVATDSLIEFSVSQTTRPRREGEGDGVD
jgi:guanylate kinase